MTNRKFTPPTEFPAEYVDGKGDKITLLARGKGVYKYAGQGADGKWQTYREDGAWGPDANINDLHDIPQKQVHWANDYGKTVEVLWMKSREVADKVADEDRIAVIRREWVEGELPQYFVEEV